MPSIILGVSSSIAAYKAPQLVRYFVKNGIDVHVVLTKKAIAFVAPYTLQVVSENPVIVESDNYNMLTSHIDLCRKASTFIIAPCSANTLSKCAHGFADDVLTTAFLAFKGKKMIVPAMHTEMWTNTIIQENVVKLLNKGITIFGPEEGALSSGDYGEGRFLSEELIFLAYQWLGIDTKSLNLTGKKILVTAGGCCENIDTVRCISNRSSGSFGHFIANCASFFGAKVTLLSSAKQAVFPNVTHYGYTTHDDLSQLIYREIATHDYLIMLAAVSDFLPVLSGTKLPRKSFDLRLNSSVDILKSIPSSSIKKIGFCLSDTWSKELALQKLHEKDCEYMVLNDASQFGQSKRTYYLYDQSNNCVHKCINQELFKAAYDLLINI